MKKLFTKKDLIIIAITLVVGLLGLLIINNADAGKNVVIKVNGKIVETVSLAEKGYETEVNGVVICVNDGKAFVRESSCKDKICVNSGELSKSGEGAVCAPNGVSVEISGENDNLPDAITG